MHTGSVHERVQCRNVNTLQLTHVGVAWMSDGGHDNLSEVFYHIMCSKESLGPKENNCVNRNMGPG